MTRDTSRETHPLFSGIKPGWVLLGVGVDWVMTFVLGTMILPLFIDAGAWELGEKAFAEYLKSLEQNPAYIIVSLLLGSMATAIGGYVAARKAKQVQLKHGLWVSVASAMSVAIIPGESWSSTMPIWAIIAGWALLLPAGIFGGYLAKTVQR